MLKRAILPIFFVASLICAQERTDYTAKVSGRTSPDGKPIQCDLPGSLHLHNCGGSDGAGLCVPTSITHAARWQGIEVLQDFQNYMKQFPGGGWPDKVDRYIKKICTEKGVPVPSYVHVTEMDLDFVRRCTATSRFVCNTYCISPTGRYNGRPISHMVNTPHADDKWFAVLDNNYEGEDNYEWMSTEEYKRTVSCGGKPWFLVFLTHGPPPQLVP
jgi:inorganic pyrophosphatase